MKPRTDWDPLQELLSVQKRMNELFESALARTNFDPSEDVDRWTPVCDVYESAQALRVQLELPGVEPSTIEVKVEGDDLIVAGERRMEHGRSGKQHHRIERSYGKFSRRFRLPSSVDPGAVRASFQQGVLDITLPARSGLDRRPIRVSID